MSGTTFKKIMSLGAVVLTAGLGALMLQGCATPKSVIKPVEKTNFEAVTNHLDPNGSLYFFADTTDFMNKADGFTASLKNIIPECTKDPKYQRIATAAVDMGLKYFRESGMKEIGGFGVSSIMLSNELCRSKTFLYRNKSENPASPLWNFIGTTPHELKILKMLPANTITANFSDINVEMMASWLARQIKTSGVAELQNGYAELKIKSEATMGMGFKTLFAGIDNHAGTFITVNSERSGLIPIGNKLMKIPEPSIAIVIAVKDERIYDFIKSKTSAPMGAKESELEGAKALIFNQLPFPVRIQPAMAQKDGWLIIASNPDVIKDFFSANSAKLVDTDKFKTLSKGIPLNANGFEYVDSKFGEILTNVQRHAMENSEARQIAPLLNKINSINSRMDIFKVHQVLDDGILSVANSNFNVTTMLLSQMSVVPAALMTGMLIPALDSAREKSRRISCAGNIKQMGLALKQYAMDHKDKFPEADGVAGLEVLRKEQYLTNPNVYVCPSTSQQPAQSGQPLSADNVSYVYFGGFMEGADVVNIPLIFDRPGNHKRYVNVLFGDGHVEGHSGNFKTCRDIVEHILKALPGKISESNSKLLLEKAELFDTGKVR